MQNYYFLLLKQLKFSVVDKVRDQLSLAVRNKFEMQPQILIAFSFLQSETNDKLH
jgi:hypothetical protein